MWGRSQMKFTLQEQHILKELSESVLSPTPRGPKPADYEKRLEERRALRRQVGDLINRYEQWLKEQDNVR